LVRPVHLNQLNNNYYENYNALFECLRVFDVHCL
jgi:hypothetical protein